MDFPTLESPVLLSEVNDLARARVDHRRSGHCKRFVALRHGKADLDEHPGAKAHLRVRNLYAHRDRPRLRVDHRVDECDTPVDTAVGRIPSDFRGMSNSDRRYVGLVQLCLHPHCAQVRECVKRFARADVLPLGHLPFGHDAAGGGIDRQVNLGLRRTGNPLNLLCGQPPELESSSACCD